MGKKIQSVNQEDLFEDLSLLIEQSRKQITTVANSTLTLLFWKVGKRIFDEILNRERATYGKQIIANISIQLEANYGRNFTEKNIRRMIQFAEEFPDFEIVVTLSRQLSWSHFLVIIPLKETRARIYYSQLVAKQQLGVRDLRYQISRKAYERSEIANFQQTQIDDSLHHTFKDPYLLDFLGLKNSYLENDLEQAILHDLETFILELGKGFAFMERQKRMIIDGEDFYLDLLFFNRNLKRLVAIELKIGKFEPAFKGQMDLYLKWLNKYERQEGEKEPVGLILCAETNKEQVELLEMHKDGIMVAEYWTEMPPKKELEKKLHQLLLKARERIERNRLR